MKTKKIKLKVKGMHCKSCEVLIKDELEEQEGITDVQISHETGEFTADIDENKISVQKVKDIIKEQGYKV